MRYLHVALTAGILLAGGIVVGAHGNHVTVGNQMSDDGTVLVEALYVSESGYLVLHADEDGTRGAVVGHEPLERGFHSSVSVQTNGSYWASQTGTTTVRAVLYGDDGDGEFVLDEDQPLRSFGQVASEQFAVEKIADGKAYVAAASPWYQQVDGAVTIRDVALPEDGHVVVREVDRTADDSTGEIVGRTSLSAGVHANVTVDVDASFYAEQNTRFELWTTVYGDDGDGAFDAETDSPVLVDGEPVMTRFGVRKADGSSLVRTPTDGNDSSANTPVENNSSTSDTQIDTTA